MKQRLINANALKNLAEKVACCGLIDLDVLKIMIDHAPTIDAAPRWIPCGEKLPEEYGLYIVTMNDGSVQECSYVPTDYGDVLLNDWSTCEASGFKVLNENDVLAWMPLPEPYKRGGEDERSHKSD